MKQHKYFYKGDVHGSIHFLKKCDYKFLDASGLVPSNITISDTYASLI